MEMLQLKIPVGEVCNGCPFLHHPNPHSDRCLLFNESLYMFGDEIAVPKHKKCLEVSSHIANPTNTGEKKQ